MKNILTGDIVKYDDETKTYIQLVVNDQHEMKPCEYSDSSYLIDNITYPNSTFKAEDGFVCIDYQTLSNQSITGNMSSTDTLTLSVKPCNDNCKDDTALKTFVNTLSVKVMGVGREVNLAERTYKPMFTKQDEIKVQILNKGWQFSHKVALRKNEVNLFDWKWIPWSNTSESHEFYDFAGVQSTLDFGLHKHLMDVRFYQHNTVRVHSRISFTLLELMAEVGGLAVVLYMLVSFFVLPLASFGLSLSLIQDLYWFRTADQDLAPASGKRRFGKKAFTGD